MTNTGFAGCIRDLQLDKRTRDLNENKFAKGILPGCSNVSGEAIEIGMNPNFLFLSVSLFSLLQA